MKVPILASCVLLLFIAATPSAGAGRPAVPEVVGLPILKARKLVIAAGWSPRPTFLLTDDDPMASFCTLENSWLQAGDLYRAGAIEVESCAPTGTAPCNFNYRHGAFCLRLGSDGESDDPVVVAYDDRCPDSETLKPPRNLNLLGRTFPEAKEVLTRIGWSLGPGEKESCTATAAATCTFRFVREKECQVLTTGEDAKQWGPGTVVLRQTDSCPAAPESVLQR